ncbi:AraC-like DNA-binding protein [Roseiarcus fermentans]|uniref:AraC-like DNA-binding protein n=1 Tax=Roseiarcus fermentans TaxID=1473586 RepID=A0A366FNR0_9HYPH|nr:AraC family transcriptional regulator [Roseiarcus fermentans]RBP16211.1 AraC-like DNA-binding protein [Roseiarcus fermentans]
MTKRASPTSIGVSARRVVAALSARGVDPNAVLRRAGLCLEDVSDTDRRLSARAENALIELAAEATDEPLFGLRLTEESVFRETGLIFYMLKASATLGSAIALYARYIPIANAGRVLEAALPAEGPGTVVFHYVGAPRPSLRHTVEYHMTAFVKYMRDVAGPQVSPSCVTVSHARSGPIDPFERFFRCPVAFGGEADRLVFDRATLDTPTLEGDPALLELLCGYADKAMTRLGGAKESFRAAVETEVHRKLPHGGASIDEVARALNIGTRSLIRRLSEEGTSFSEVRDTLRRSLALAYLKNEQLSLCQIAWLLGYSEIGAFSTGFRRWFATTPGAARDDADLLARLDRPGRPPAAAS